MIFEKNDIYVLIFADISDIGVNRLLFHFADGDWYLLTVTDICR